MPRPVTPEASERTLHSDGRGSVDGAGLAQGREISIVVPCHDATWLGELLGTLVAQSDAPPFEVVVVCCPGVQPPDAPAELEVRVIGGEAPWTAGANRNVGVRHARGELLLFLDADDTVASGYVAAMVAALRSAPIVCSRVDLRGHQPGLHATHPQWRGIIDAELGFLPFAGAGTLGMRRDLFGELGGFDPTLRRYAEADLLWRAQLAGCPPPRWVPDAVLHHRMAPQRWARARRALRSGSAQVLLYRRFRAAGMPAELLRVAVRSWARILLGYLRGAHHGAWWATWLRIGRLWGSLRYRTRYL